MADQRDLDIAFREELVALIPRMRAFARTMCGDPTAGDDLAQDALLRALSAQASYQPGTNMKAWVFMIIRNSFYSEKRRSWRNVQLEAGSAEQMLVAVSNPDGGLELDEVRRALQVLPDDQREALILIGAGGFSYEEAAEILECAIGTIKSRVSRARDRLAAILAKGSIAKDETHPSAAMGAILSQLRAAEGERLSIAA